VSAYHMWNWGQERGVIATMLSGIVTPLSISVQPDWDPLQCVVDSSHALTRFKIKLISEVAVAIGNHQAP
jgi:hypothetical protein